MLSLLVVVLSHRCIIKTRFLYPVKVAEYIFDNDFARVERPADIGAYIQEKAYLPEYTEM